MTWTLPKEAGEAATEGEALNAARAVILRTDGRIDRLNWLMGPDFTARHF